MSDDKKIQWHPPMVLPKKEYTPQFQIDYKKLFQEQKEFYKTPIFWQTPKPKEVKKEDNIKNIGETLLAQWKPVMIAESKVKNPILKADPNISLQFFNEIEQMAKRLNCDAEDIAAIIYRESHFDPNIKSKSKKYAGLIQMDKTTFNVIKGQDKCTYEEYCALPREKQLKYAEAYIQFRIKEKGLTGKHLTGGQIYTLIHKPKDINNPEEVLIHQKRVDNAKKAIDKFKPLNTKS